MANKLLESRYLDRALDLLTIQPSGQIQSSETPDFLVPHNGQTIGIEVTAFYLPELGTNQAHQARIGMQKIAVEQARREFRSRGGRALYVSVFFVSVREISKRRAYELGPILARAIANTPLPASVHEPSAHVALELLPSEVARISIHASVDGEDELWHPAFGGWVMPIERDHVDAEIARKADFLPAIRIRCETAWLLIVNDVFRGAAPAELSADARRFEFQSPFDRTLWLDSSAVHDLSTFQPDRHEP